MSNNFSNAIFRHTHAYQVETVLLYSCFCSSRGWMDGVFVGSYRGHSSLLSVVMFLLAHYDSVPWTFPVQYTERQCQVISAHCQVVFSSPSGASHC